MKLEFSIGEAYEILELPSGAFLEEAEAAYRALATQVHPDRFQNNPKMQSHAEDEQRKLNEAIRVLRVYWKMAPSGGNSHAESPHPESSSTPRHESPAPIRADTKSPPPKPEAPLQSTPQQPRRKLTCPNGWPAPS